MIGSTIGSYRITGLLGEGGMGAVYRATDNIEREVAIKALHSQLTRDESRLQRFHAEAVALGRLHHPNIATLYHLLEQNGDYFMVMEYVEGQTLEDIVRKKGAMTPEMALAVFDDGLEGFQHAHSRGVIHRDIKPSNLMVSTEGITKITDFGIARMAGAGRMTQTGKVIGTLEYMSPEQVRGLEQDARSDIYSLGILLFELLTGRMPFSATSDYAIMHAHLEEVPPPASSIIATLPSGLDAVIAKALAKDPAARFQSVQEMRTAIAAIARELPTPAPPQTLLSAPEPVLAPTRQADIPSAPPPTSQAPVATSEARSIAGGTPGGNIPAGGVSPRAGGYSGSGASSRPATPTMPKWAIPAGVGLVALLLVGGLMSFASRKGPVEVVPTPAPTQQVAVNPDAGTNSAAPETANTSSEDKTEEGGSSSGMAGITGNSGQVAGIGGVPVEAPTQPQSQATPVPLVIPGTNSKPPAPPTPKPVAPPAPRTRVVEKPPAPRRRERVAEQPRPKPRTRVRVIERPRPKPRVRVVERPQPKPRVVSRPTRKRASGGGGGQSEEAIARSIIKGN